AAGTLRRYKTGSTLGASVLDLALGLRHTAASPGGSMPVVAVVNRKGGSGKSTFAAHAAAWCARQGHAVMLGDIDRQQSSRGWLRRRDPSLPAIAPSVT